MKSQGGSSPSRHDKLIIYKFSGADEVYEATIKRWQTAGDIQILGADEVYEATVNKIPYKYKHSHRRLLRYEIQKQLLNIKETIRGRGRKYRRDPSMFIV